MVDLWTFVALVRIIIFVPHWTYIAKNKMYQDLVWWLVVWPTKYHQTYPLKIYNLPSSFNSLLYCFFFLLFLLVLGSTECGLRGCRLNSLWCHIQPRPLLVWGWRRWGQCSGAARLTGVRGSGGGGWCWDTTWGASSNHYNTLFIAIPPHCGGFVQGKVFRLVCWISGRLGHHLVKGRVWVWTRLQLEEGRWEERLEEANTRRKM